MPLEIVVGTQWGDEGKGRVVDLMSARADIVARYNGGDNAGHTVTVGSQTFKLHLIPSGIVHPHTVGVLGNGTVIYPETLFKEIDMLRQNGLKVDAQRLRISFAAHLITPGHRALDIAQEASRGKAQLGTTGRGIGPAYTDRSGRHGLRMQNMLDTDRLHDRLVEHLEEVNHQLVALYGSQPLDIEPIARQYMEYAHQLADYITDTGAYITNALAEGKRVLAEGAQGTLLDLDLGTYPFVTSSHPVSAGALVGLGIGIPQDIDVTGVTKAFQTRVGAGPFPTEVYLETAERLRGTGSNPWDEFGTTTGRPRRVGWLDGVLLRYATRVNSLNGLCITKLDILSDLPLLRICTAYRQGDKSFEDLPMGPADLSPFEPVYEELPGWNGALGNIRRWQDLPVEARHFVQRIEQICGVPVRQVSVGAERSQVVDVVL
jgi:adenylosuccinate synthase